MPGNFFLDTRSRPQLDMQLTEIANVRPVLVDAMVNAKGRDNSLLDGKPRNGYFFSTPGRGPVKHLVTLNTDVDELG